MVLLLYSLFFYVVFAIAAATVDTGLARLTHLQMRTGSEAGALEGMRLADGDDLARREAVRDVVSWVYDENLDTGTPDDGALFVAGPRFELDAGVGDARALQTLTIPDPPVERPVLELNTGDEPHGDMVSGRYDLDDLAHTEDGSYSRSDFEAGDGGAGARAFLVRMRRTRDPTDPSVVDPLDDEAGVSSSGAALPYLFGRGALLSNEHRRRGITVRATAIAAARPAMTVGRAFADGDGAAPFTLSEAFWNALEADPVALGIEADGSLTSEGAPVGFFVVRRVWSVGNTLPPAVPASAVDPAEVLVPVHASLDAERVVGFGRIAVVEQTADSLTVVRLPGAVAPRNASAVVAPGLAGLARATVRELMERNRALQEPVTAPVLVR